MGTQSVCDAVTTLTDLGLSMIQARVYLALVKTGLSTARVTAKTANVARQDIYRIINELKEKGLVFSTVSNPTQYSAVSLDDGLGLLLKSKKEKITELEKQIIEIPKTLFAYNTYPEDSCNFILIPEKDPIQKRVENIFCTAKTCIDMMNDKREMLIAHQKHFISKTEALNREVLIREIIFDNKDKPFRLPQSFLSYLDENPNLQLKTLYALPSAQIIIKDNSEVLIGTKTSTNTLAQPFLWSNNKVITQIVREWFNFYWSQAEKTDQ